MYRKRKNEGDWRLKQEAEAGNCGWRLRMEAEAWG